MRYVIFILGMVMSFTSATTAQQNAGQGNSTTEDTAPENPAYARLLATPYFTLAPASATAATAAPLGLAPGTLTSPTAPAARGASATAAPAPFAMTANASPFSPAADPQGVQGVFVTYKWQAYFGYTFTRLYEVPGRQLDTNGFNYSMVYYIWDWFGLDGEFAATHDSQFSFDGWLLFGGGGPRFRWSGPRGLELWGHVLLGYSHLTPQTSYGSEDAFAYTAGGGADINILRSRWALRLGADMLATRYFGTYQFSPKAFGGVVFKF